MRWLVSLAHYPPSLLGREPLRLPVTTAWPPAPTCTCWTTISCRPPCRRRSSARAPFWNTSISRSDAPASRAASMLCICWRGVHLLAWLVLPVDDAAQLLLALGGEAHRQPVGGGELVGEHPLDRPLALARRGLEPERDAARLLQELEAFQAGVGLDRSRRAGDLGGEAGVELLQAAAELDLAPCPGL